MSCIEIVLIYFNQFLSENRPKRKRAPKIFAYWAIELWPANHLSYMLVTNDGQQDEWLPQLLKTDMKTRMPATYKREGGDANYSVKLKARMLCSLLKCSCHLQVTLIIHDNPKKQSLKTLYTKPIMSIPCPQYKSTRMTGLHLIPQQMEYSNHHNYGMVRW